MAARALSENEVASALVALPSWRLRDGKLHRLFVFRDFGEAFGFMTRSALLAERLDHHPEWLNVWSRVEVWLTTHDCGGLSDLDLEMARRMEGFALPVSESSHP